MKAFYFFLAGMSAGVGMLGALVGAYAIAAIGFLCTAIDLFLAFYSFPEE